MHYFSKHMCRNTYKFLKCSLRLNFVYKFLISKARFEYGLQKMYAYTSVLELWFFKVLKSSPKQTLDKRQRAMKKNPFLLRLKLQVNIESINFTSRN